MAESLDLFNEVRQLRSRVEQLEGLTETLVRAQSSELVKSILDHLASDRALREVFLRVDGRRAQNEIVAELKQAGVRGASPATVSRKLETLLNELHLVELVDRTAKGNVYRRSNLDRILGISRSLGR
jgi:hypothetical protein